MGEISCSDCGVAPTDYHHAPGCPRYGTAPSDMAPATHDPNCRVCRGQQVLRDAPKVARANQLLGELTQIAFAGTWRGDVEAFDMCADVERYTEVSRLLTLAVKLAAQGNWSDAIDSARSAAATCPEVPALAADVGRIIAILEAP